MGLSRCGIYIEGASADVTKEVATNLGLIPLGAAPLREAPDQSEIATEEIGIASANDWGVVLCDPKPFLALESSDRLSGLSAGRRIFFWLTESATAGLWFEMHEDGRMTRRWVESESVVQENYGPELRQEPAGFFSSEDDEERERDEWALLSLVHAVTGVSEDTLFSIGFTVYRATAL